MIQSLSSQQQHVLQWLLILTRRSEQHDPKLLEKGFQWRLKVADKSKENGRRASMSRTLKRLEDRGLIKRIKGRKKLRTVRVILSPEGRRVAEELGA